MVLHVCKDAEGSVPAGTPLLNVRAHHREDRLSWDGGLRIDEERRLIEGARSQFEEMEEREKDA